MICRSAWVLTVVLALSGSTCARLSAAFGSAPPEPAKVRTQDGVELSLNYYPSSAANDPPRGKQVTPVVLLHDEKDTQGVFSSLAARLQSAGGDGTASDFCRRDRRPARARREHPTDGPQWRNARARRGQNQPERRARHVDPGHGSGAGLSGRQERRRRTESEQAVPRRRGFGRDRGRELGRAGLERPAVAGRQTGPGRQSAGADFAAVEVSGHRRSNKRCAARI